jgi:hypothetical protein
MNPVRPAENRPGQDPQIFSSRSNTDFSSACDRLGKIQPRRAGGKNLSGSNRRTAFSRANATTTYYLPPHHKPDNNKKPLTQCPFFRSKPRVLPHWAPLRKTKSCAGPRYARSCAGQAGRCFHTGTYGKGKGVGMGIESRNMSKFLAVYRLARACIGILRPVKAAFFGFYFLLVSMEVANA